MLTMGMATPADRWSSESGRGRLYTQAFGVMLASPFLFLFGHADSRIVLIFAYAVRPGFTQPVDAASLPLSRPSVAGRSRRAPPVTVNGRVIFRRR